MKKISLILAFIVGFVLVSCGGKKADKATNAATTTTKEVSAAADTIIMDYGTITVDSISPDSVDVSIQDTVMEMIGIPKD